MRHSYVSYYKLFTNTSILNKSLLEMVNSEWLVLNNERELCYLLE